MSRRPRLERRRLAVVLAAAFLLLLAVGFSAAPSLYEVQAKGDGPPIVPYEGGGDVYKIRILDAVTIYADEESRPIPDKISSSGLIAIATMSLMALLLLRAAHAGPRLMRFFLLLSIGLAYLAADELLAIHETVGHNLRFLADVPGVERPDDLVFALYIVPVAWFAWAFRDIFRGERTVVALLAAGAAFFLLAAAGDVAGVGIDEPAEVVASLLLAAGLVLLTARVLSRELGLDGGDDLRVPVDERVHPPALTR